MYRARAQLQPANPSNVSGALDVTEISKNDVTIVLPVLNEEEGVGAVIDELSDCGFPKILVIDGYSTDLTPEVARRRGVTAIQQHGRGKTGAIRTAIEHVTTPYMLIMDGDFTYSAHDIQRLLNHAKGYDQIIGARSRDNISLIHRFGNHIISGIFNVLFGTGISDVCSGMYLLKTSAARELVFHSTGFSVEAEILAQMAVNGKVTEVPIEYRTRIGEPKLSTIIHGGDIMHSIFRLARTYNPVFLFSMVAGFAAIPGLALLSWVLLSWLQTGEFHSGWALTGVVLLLLSSQIFTIGTISLLLKRSEIRLERLVRAQNEGKVDRRVLENSPQ
jgi:dolichol-phosphate mannosyltransferase